MTLSAQPTSAPQDVVAAALRLLAAHGPAARSDVLAFVLGGRPHLSSLVLRAGVRGEVVAAAGDVSSPAPSPRRAADDHWVLDLPVRALGSTYGVLTAVSARPLTATEAGLLATIADLFAVLSATPVDPAVAARLVLDVEADFALLATDLDETLGEALVALRHTDSSRLDEAVRGALSTLRRVRRDLHATALQDGLDTALRELAGSGVTVVTNGISGADVTPPVAVLVERVAEACCRNAVGPVQITATSDAATVKLTVQSADNEMDASELERWRRRVEALRGTLRHQPGCVEVQLPVDPGDEGHHDNRPDL